MQVNLYDYAPRIGSGWRRVELVSEGWKWTKIKYVPLDLVNGSPIFERPIHSKILNSIWAKLPKKKELTRVR